MSDLEKLLPTMDEANAPYWEGLRQRRLVLPRCDDCGEYRLKASRYCPSCGSQKTTFTQVSGRGRIWARCAFHQVYFAAFRDRVPYTVVIVALDEGPRLYSNLAEDGGIDSVAIGTPVEAVYEDVGDTATLVKFRPV